MNEVVNINGKAVERVLYKGVPVVTFKMIDELHERKSDTAGGNFRTNKKYFVECEDFFRLEKSELQSGNFPDSSDDLLPLPTSSKEVGHA